MYIFKFWAIHVYVELHGKQLIMYCAADTPKGVGGGGVGSGEKKEELYIIL